MDVGDAPRSDAGRGLKLRVCDRFVGHGKDAPRSDAGRGLKPSDYARVGEAAADAPRSDAGRGLKRYLGGLIMPIATTRPAAMRGED